MALPAVITLKIFTLSLEQFQAEKALKLYANYN